MVSGVLQPDAFMDIDFRYIYRKYIILIFTSVAEFMSKNIELNI